MLYTINTYRYTARTSTFPGGEEYVRLDPRTHPTGIDGDITIYPKITSSKEVMKLLMLHDALKIARPKATFTLHMGYLPYARQDRVCNKGESFSLKVFCNIINAAKFDKVIVEDCHSMVGLALLDNVVEVPQLTCFEEVAQAWVGNIDAIIAPDAGATKKAQTIADAWHVPLIQCLKRRTDRGIRVNVCEDVTGLDVVVVDDIIDGGGTFIPLAEALKDAKTKRLYATHGIFSKGKETLNSLYDEIAVYNDWTNPNVRQK